MINAYYITRFILSMAAGLAVFVCAALPATIPGQAIVRLEKGFQPTPTLRNAGFTVLDSIPGQNIYLVSYPANSSAESRNSFLAGMKAVRWAEPNRKLQVVETQQMSVSFPDEYAPQFLSGEQPNNYYDQPAVYSIGLDSAHAITQADGVRIAVVDNGVTLAHPLFADLEDSLMYDFVDSDPVPEEGSGPLLGHGTFVTGLVLLAAPQAEILVVRTFDGEGTSTTFRVAQAINWAVNHGADVINMSFGTPTNSTSIAQACSRAIDSGIVLVAAAGNGGTIQTMYPASLPGVIAVGAIDSNYAIAAFSNGSDSMDLCAPGVAVYSALTGQYEWGIWSGTSFSAPFVSAIAGMVRAVNPEMAPAAVESHLRTTATRSLPWGTVEPPDQFYGFGLIDAFSAVLAYRMGDLNNSGALDIADLADLIEIVTTGAVPDGRSLRQADLNQDGKVDEADIQRASLLLFGSPTVKPARQAK